MSLYAVRSNGNYAMASVVRFDDEATRALYIEHMNRFIPKKADQWRVASEELAPQFVELSVAYSDFPEWAKLGN